MPSERPIRVLIAKPGLDGHDKGAKIVAKGLKDAGMEVIYTGIRQSTESIIAAAVQEDVEVIGVSILSGAHLPICRDLAQKIGDSNLGDTLFLAGGTIPKKDVESLIELGIARVFRPSSKLDDIVAFIQSEVAKRRTKGSARQ
jgi:methylmalonyl-CoA mutase C-terminal domain/subunit